MARYGDILKQVDIHDQSIREQVDILGHSIREQVKALDQADREAEKDRDEFVDELIGKVVKYEEKAKKLAKAVEAKDAEIMKIRENLKVKEAEVVSQTRENKKLAKTLKARDLELKSALELNDTEGDLHCLTILLWRSLQKLGRVTGWPGDCGFDSHSRWKTFTLRNRQER
jgi:predicted RNase H-like nuclease (RuvC/YqgF family)